MKNSEIALGAIKRVALDLAFSIVKRLVSKIKNNAVKDLVEMSIEPLEDVVNIVTDRVPDNGKQLIDLLEEKGDEYAIKLLKVVKGLILQAKKMNPDFKAIVVELLDAILLEFEAEVKKSNVLDGGVIGKSWEVK